MADDKNIITGSTSMLILKLLDISDMYGYQMIQELSKRSNDTFNLKAGTLYPILHSMVKDDLITCYEKLSESGKVRKYYSITKIGKGVLQEKSNEWKKFSNAINNVLNGGVNYVTI